MNYTLHNSYQHLDISYTKSNKYYEIEVIMGVAFIYICFDVFITIFHWLNE